MSQVPSVVTSIKTANDLSELLQVNPGLIIIKLGATWCGPCKKIEPLVIDWLQKMPSNVCKCIIDIDENIDLYGFYKKKRVVQGVPTIMAYYEGNDHYIPDDITFGSDPKSTNDFFLRCVEYLKSLEPVVSINAR
jgi:thioredoxin 1